jgi:hypothetical protein
MPKLTLQEFVCNLHNWVHNNRDANDGEGSIGVSHKSIPQYLALLEEWDEFLVNDEPRVMKLRRAVSIFCEKIVNSKDVDVGFRARAAKFLVSEPVAVHEPPAVVVEARPLVPWEDPQWNAIPEDMRGEARQDLLEWVPEEDGDVHGEGDDVHVEIGLAY